MRRWALPLLLLAGALALLILLFVPVGSASDPDRRSTGPRDSTSTPGAIAEPAAGASGAQEPGAIERSGADPRTEQPPPNDQHLLEVLVLRRADGSPVPEAEVLVITLQEQQEREAAEEFFLGTSVEAFMEKFGVRYRADAQGIARIPQPKDDSVLMASKGALFGLGTWRDLKQHAGARAQIEVEVSPDLLIRVRDESGRPVAGVMVALRVGAGDYFSFDILRARTGEDGIGRIAKAAAFARIFAPAEGASLSVALATVLAEAVSAPVDLANMPTDPIELVLPPTGSVRVLLRNPDGTPTNASLLVALAKARANPEDDDDWLAPGMPGFDARSGRTESGELIFDHIGLGLSLQASAVFPGAPQASIARRPGPQRAGETVEVVLTEQRDYPILLVQAQDRDGRPLAKQRLKVRFLMQDEQVDLRNEQETRSDANGRVRLALLPVAAEEQALAVVWERPAKDGLPELSARTELAQALRFGENELGIVRLLEAPVLASGRVLDAEGKPLANATVVPMHRRASDFAPQESYLEADFERARSTDLLGGFILTGSWQEPELTLEAQAAGYLSASVVVAPGATGVEIRLPSSFGLAGRLLADPGVDLSRLALQLRYLRVDAGAPPLGVSVDPENGRFNMEGAPAGMAELVISVPGLLADDGEILRISGLQVGTAPPDPRLDPIDLRGKLHGCILQARKAGGGDLQDLQAWPAADPEAVSYGWEGTVSLIAAAPLGEVVVTAAGCRELRLTPLKPREEVELQPGLPVRLSLAAAAGAGEGSRLGVFLFPEDDAGAWTRGARALFGLDGSADLLVARTGRFRVEFIVAPADAEQPAAGWWNFAWVPRAEAEPPQRIEVLESGAAQSFRLDPPPAARVAEAAASLTGAKE